MVATGRRLLTQEFSSLLAQLPISLLTLMPSGPFITCKQCAQYAMVVYHCNPIEQVALCLLLLAPVKSKHINFCFHFRL